MSEIKKSKKSVKNKSAAPAEKSAKENAAPRRKKSGKIITIILGCVTALACVAVVVWYAISTTSMEEIDTGDESVQELLYSYFFNNYGCYDSTNNLLKNENVDISKLDASVKEGVLFSYLARYQRSDISYAELNQSYKNYFGENENLAEKDTYEVIEGSYVKNDDGKYIFHSNCGSPEMTTCVVLDKAYKNNDAMKLVLKVLTIDRVNGPVYTGVDTSGTVLDENILESSENVDAADLPRWEVYFKKDNAENYIIKSTHPVK